MKLGFVGTGAITSAIVTGLINEQVVGHVKNTGALAAVSDALNAVLQGMKAVP
jgi:pyrroline-5-carboxylate reductase